MILYRIPKLPRYLSRREVVRFAFLPTKMEQGEVIWLQRYISLQQFEFDRGGLVSGFYWEEISKYLIKQ